MHWHVRRVVLLTLTDVSPILNNIDHRLIDRAIDKEEKMAPKRKRRTNYEITVDNRNKEAATIVEAARG
jgi:hypothetical protein